jgi:hypothetical protein
VTGQSSWVAAPASPATGPDPLAVAPPLALAMPVAPPLALAMPVAPPLALAIPIAPPLTLAIPPTAVGEPALAASSSEFATRPHDSASKTQKFAQRDPTISS